MGCFIESLPDYAMLSLHDDVWKFNDIYDAMHKDIKELKVSNDKAEAGQKCESCEGNDVTTIYREEVNAKWCWDCYYEFYIFEGIEEQATYETQESLRYYGMI